MRFYGITILMYDDVHTVIPVHSKVSDSFKVYGFDLIMKIFGSPIFDNPPLKCDG